MELRDALVRIVGLRWRVIVGVVVLAVLAGAALEARRAETYTASARIVVAAQDPRSFPEATAIADTVEALATSRSVVESALATPGTPDRDLRRLAEAVSARAVGVSGVVELSVRDRSPADAAAIANALAQEVVDSRTDASEGTLRRTLETTADRIEALRVEAVSLDATARRLDAEEAVTPTELATTRARRQEVARQRALVADELGSLESLRADLVETSALRPTPWVVSRAVPPTRADPVNVVGNLGLAGIIGLAVAILVAALFELFRPRVVGGDAVASELDAAHLGTLPHGPDRNQPVDGLATIRTRLRLVAEGLGRPHVYLVTADWLGDEDHDENHLLAAQLTPSAAALGDRTPPHTQVRVRPLSSQPTPVLEDPSRSGLVLMSPTVVEKSKLEEVDRLARLASLPILGVITYRGRERARGPDAGAKRARLGRVWRKVQRGSAFRRAWARRRMGGSGRAWARRRMAGSAPRLARPWRRWRP